jgi:D-glucuronyl C5-epimerase C-terminus
MGRTYRAHVAIRSMSAMAISAMNRSYLAPGLVAIVMLGDGLPAADTRRFPVPDPPDPVDVSANVIAGGAVQPTNFAVPAQPTGLDDARSVASVAILWRTYDYTIRTLTPKERFELRDGKVTTAWPPTRIHDRYGVPMRIIDGQRRYHPLGLVRLGLKYLSRHRLTGDPLFLDRAKRIAAGLQRIAVRTPNAVWFPYRFRWPGNRPPWYSGYAQGFALSFFVRLWEVTKAKRYRVLADLTYNSLRTLRRASAPWVTWVDGNRYLWIDEYPQQLDRTFNGHVFALVGLHDYYEMTKRTDLYSAARNANVLAVLRGGITTIHAYASTFRNPGAVSDYCLAHHVRNRHYHPVHVMQLRYLAVMTGDPWFERMADNFWADFH